MKKTLPSTLNEVGPAIFTGIALIVAWEVYVRSGFIAPSILPSPMHIVDALSSHWKLIGEHTLQTGAETLIGLVIAVFLGSGLDA